MTTEIIVYRNPAEQAMWNSIMNGSGSFIPVFSGIVVFFIVFVMLNVFMDFFMFGRKLKYRHRNQKFNPQYILLGIAAAVGSFVTYSLWI